MNAMARNTPPAKELAIPSTFGLSRQLEDHVGIMPLIKASAKITIIKPIFVQKIRLGFSGSALDRT